jgi:hypothetical protein
MFLDTPIAYGRLVVLPLALLPATGGWLRTGFPFRSPLRSTSLRSSTSLFTVPSTPVAWLRNSDFPCGPSKSRCLVPNSGFPFDRIPVLRYPVQIGGSPVSTSPFHVASFRPSGHPCGLSKVCHQTSFPVLPVGLIILLHRSSLFRSPRRGHIQTYSCGEF